MQMLGRMSCRARGVATRWVFRGAERGDVPGWVLVTVMSAGLVTVLWSVAGDRLTDLFVTSLDGVIGP